MTCKASQRGFVIKCAVLMQQGSDSVKSETDSGVGYAVHSDQIRLLEVRTGLGIGQIVGQQDSRTAGQLRTADRRTAGTVLARYHQLPPTTWAWRAVLG